MYTVKDCAGSVSCLNRRELRAVLRYEGLTRKALFFVLKALDFYRVVVNVGALSVSRV